MPKATHHPWEDRSFGLGVNSSLDKEILGRKDGEYLGARNMRPNNMDGDFGVLKTVKGEELLYPASDTSWNTYYATIGKQFSSGRWRCMAATYVLVEGEPRIVELWADENELLPSFIRIGGKIVCASENLTIHHSYPIQIDTSDTQDGSEIFFTDNHSAPLYMDVYDMLLNSGENLGNSTGENTEKYFSGFDISNYLLQLQQYGHHPVFKELTKDTSYSGADIFTPPTGDPGLIVGQHCYRARYSNESGDKTGFCIPTPLISVINRVREEQKSVLYPREGYSGEAENIQSDYGIVLQVRVENRNNYEYIEITRISYVGGLALGTTPTEVLVGKVALAAGEISIKTIVDFGGDEGDISTEEQADTFNAIETCKSIRYFNNRLHLGNVRYASKEILSEAFDERFSIFPVLQNMGTAGHSDPYNDSYYKNYMSGEKYGFALVGFDSNFGRSFAIPLPDSTNIQMPERRTQMDAMSELYSYGDVPLGCDVDNNPDVPVFERFSLKNAYQKTLNSVRSVLDGEYSPMSPAYEGYEFNNLDDIVNTHVLTDDDTWVAYSPKAFAPEFFSQGIAVYGIDIDKFPDWVTCFTIVRTRPANKVKFQGLGFYSLTGTKGKDLNKVRFYSPDTDSLSGIVNVENFQDNLDSFKITPVAPYGLFGELFDGSSYAEDSAYGANIIYAHLIKDDDTININGSSHGDGGYTTFGKWRNSTVLTGVYDQYDIESFEQYVGDDVNTTRSPDPEGNSEYFELTLSDNIYNNGEAASVDDYYTDYQDMNEPVYLYNITNEQAIVPERTVMEYFDTGSFFKRRSCIGVFTTISEYPLVDERWEDCIPYPTDGHELSTRNSFVYIKNNGVIKKWWNATYLTDQQLQDFLTGYQLNGYYDIPETHERVYGVYTHIYNSDRDIRIVFGKTIGDVVFNPAIGDEIWVYFDSGMPLRVFGGDSYVGNAIFAPVDRKSNGNNAEGLKEYYVGFPYNGFRISDNIHGLNTSPAYFRLKAIQQLVCTFVCESRTNINFGYGIRTANDATIPSPYNCFPYMNYVMRYGELGRDPAYDTDYPAEDEIMDFGGFRFRHKQNIDFYHNANSLPYFSKPAVGYRDRTQFRTRIHYSQQRVINVQDNPNLRTFLPGNIWDISDVNGEIKYLYDSLSSRGNNIYAITDRGACLLLIGKNILSQADGVELATMIGTQGTYIGGELWLSNTIGMPLDTWMSAAEGDDMLFFANKDSVYMFNGEIFTDTGRKMFHNRLLPHFPTINNYHLTGAYDPLHKEYWLQTNGITYAYSVLTEHWNDLYDYKFDRYVSFNNRIFGVNNLSLSQRTTGGRTDEIGNGTTIGGEEILNEVYGVCLPEQGYPNTAIPFINGKEFIRVRLNTNYKPASMDFFDEYGGIIQTQLFDEDFKDYTNFEQYIPRRLEVADNNRKRMQGRKLIYRITYTGNDFIVRNVGIQYKELK